MIGFIKKDFAMIKSNFKLLIVLLIIYIFMGLSGELDISFVLPVLSVMVMISTFSYDDYNNWNAYATTLPNGRKNSVRAKYITTFLTIIIVAIITILASLIITSINNKELSYQSLSLTMSSAIFGTVLVETIMYPIIYKFGLEKARIILFIIIFSVILIGAFFINYIDLSFINLSFLDKTFAFIEKHPISTIIIISTLLQLISYKISLKVHLKKDF